MRFKKKVIFGWLFVAVEGKGLQLSSFVDQLGNGYLPSYRSRC